MHFAYIHNIHLYEIPRTYALKYIVDLYQLKENEQQLMKEVRPRNNQKIHI